MRGIYLKLTSSAIIYRIKGMHLANKLIISYLLILIFPLSAFALYYSNQFEKNETKKAYEIGNQILINTKKDIENKIEICAKNAQTILDYSDLMDFISQRRNHSSTEMINFNKIYITMFSRVHYVNPDVYQFRLFIDNPNFPEIWPFIYSEKRIKSKELYKNVLKLTFDSYWLLNHKEDTYKTVGPSPQSVVSMYTNVRYPGRRHFATLEVSMLSEVFFSDLYRNANNKDMNFYVIKDKKVLFATSNNKGSKGNGINKKFASINFLKNTFKTSGSFSVKALDKNLIVLYTYLRSINSYLYTTVSLSSVYQKMSYTKLMIVLTAIITLLLLAILTYLITSIILKKMKIIVNSMREVQLGNLQASIPISGNDEIGELAHHFRKMLKKINELINELINKQSAVKDAEIKALNSQINRHFIYNTLEKLKILSDQKDNSGEVGQAISSLAKIMRYNAKWNRQNVSLKQEIGYIKDYVALVNLSSQHEPLITLEIDISEEFYNNEILKMTIQPLIENSISHGTEPKGSGIVKISAFADETALNINITDNGIGMSKEKLDTLRAALVSEEDDDTSENGIGLKNIHNRIKLFYGEEYGLDINSEENIYTCITIRLPLIAN